MARSEAYTRFIDSMVMDFDKWHDGIGYDLDALRQLEGEERAEVQAMLKRRKDSDWRDTEALAVLDEDDPAALEECLTSRNLESRLEAAEQLHGMGRLPDIDRIVAEALPKSDGPSFTRALLLAEQFPTPRVKNSLLRCARRHSDRVCRIHCAGLLFYLAGISREAFDWDHRPFFLRFGEGEAEVETAFAELCERTGADPQSADG